MEGPLCNTRRREGQKREEQIRESLIFDRGKKQTARHMQLGGKQYSGPLGDPLGSQGSYNATRRKFYKIR